MGYYIAQADVQASMSADDFTRLYDRSGDGSSAETTAYATLCIARAESRFNNIIQGRFPTPLPLPIDEDFKSIVIDLANGEAARRYPGYSGTQGGVGGPYAQRAKEATEQLYRYVRDQDRRPTVSQAGIAQPVAIQVNPTQPDGTSNSPFTTIANGEQSSDF